MAVTFHISSPLRSHTGGQGGVVLPASPATVAEALEALWRAHPSLRDRVLDERGEVRPHVNLFVGVESIRYTGGLATKVPPNGEISILPAVSGGAR